eukprot:COSAG01_NODE_65153_length_274_cov_0.588571_2_plen_27_part_01
MRALTLPRLGYPRVLVIGGADLQHARV